MQKWNLVSRHTCPFPHLFSLWFYDVPKLFHLLRALQLCQWFHVDWQPVCISSCLERMEHRLLLNLVWRCWFSCQNQCRDHFVSPTELCVTWVCSDSLYSGLGKWQESLLYLALIKIAPAVQVLDTKIWSGQHSQGSCGIEFKSTVPALACLLKIVLILGLFSPAKWTYSFFISSLICLFQLLHMSTFCVCITLHSPPFFG